MRYLVSLACAGERGVVCEGLAKDMFLDAVDGPQLRRRVLDQRPSSIDEACSLAGLAGLALPVRPQLLLVIRPAGLRLTGSIVGVSVAVEGRSRSYGPHFYRSCSTDSASGE